jgi:hypothetical protein
MTPRRSRPTPAEVQQAERLVLAAAREAAAASTRYHLIRTLGGAARWAVMDPSPNAAPPRGP